jgi:hypothetical protein
MDSRSMSVGRMEEAFASINTVELLDQIQEFQQIDLRSAPETVINKGLSTIISRMSALRYDYEGVIFRVRANPDARPFERVSDFWCPPPHAVRPDRVNDQNERVLYCALDGITAMREARVKAGEYLTFIQYRTVKPITFYWIFGPEDMSGTSEKARLNYGIIRNFIVSEFRRWVANETRFQYRLTQSIARLYMDLAERDAYAYPSMQNYSPLHQMEKGICLAVKEMSCAKVALQFALFGRLHDDLMSIVVKKRQELINGSITVMS